MEKKKFKVNFKYIEIYHFSRCLGIDKVPERGNNPLGMECIHFKSEKFDITQKKLQNIQITQNTNELLNVENLCTSTPKSSKNISFRDDDQEDDASVHSIISIDYTSKSLQPLNPMQRKKYLENAGIDISKNEESSKAPKLLSKLREDRKQVGCKCSNVGKCDVKKCICSIEGIQCQSDGNKFPCKCGDKCSNKSGKRVYSYAKIKFHYHHTLKRNMFLNEEVNIDTLSTISGDCTICGKIPDEFWKHYPENFHQTRSSKRAGGNDFQNLTLFKQLMELDENYLPTNASSNIPGSKNLEDLIISRGTVDFDKERDINNNEEKAFEFNDIPINDNRIFVTCELKNLSTHNNIDKENINFTEVLIKTTRMNNGEIDDSNEEFALQPLPSSPMIKLETPIHSNSPAIVVSSKSTSGSQKDLCDTFPFIYSPSGDFFPTRVSDITKSFIKFQSGVMLPPNAFKFNPIVLTSSDFMFSLMKNQSDKKMSIKKNKSQILSNINDIDLNYQEIDDMRRSAFVNVFSRKSSNQIKKRSMIFSTGQQKQLMPAPSHIGMNCVSDNRVHTNSNFMSRLKVIKSKSSDSSTSTANVSNVDNRLGYEKEYTLSFSERLSSNYVKSPLLVKCKRKNTRKKLIEINEAQPQGFNFISSVDNNSDLEPVKNKLFRYSDEISFFDIPYQSFENEMSPCEKEID